MPKLPRDVSGKVAIRIFGRIGYIHDHTVGSHAVLLHESDPMKRLVIPLHKIIKIGTLRRIIRDAGISVQEFTELL